MEKLKTNSVRLTKLFAAGGIAVGIIFIVLGIVVYRIPVAATVTGLVLYVGSAAVFGFIDPSTLYRGLLIKILIIIGLFKSIQAAIAYQRDKQRT